jgi:hypothetical protein
MSDSDPLLCWRISGVNKILKPERNLRTSKDFTSNSFTALPKERWIKGLREKPLEVDWDKINSFITLRFPFGFKRKPIERRLTWSGILTCPSIFFWVKQQNELKAIWFELESFLVLRFCLGSKGKWIEHNLMWIELLTSP